MPTRIACIFYYVNVFITCRVPTVLAVRKRGQPRNPLKLLWANRKVEEKSAILGLQISNPSKMKKKIPKFKSEAEERLFWQKQDSSEYIDWSDAKNVVMPKLKPLLVREMSAG